MEGMYSIGQLPYKFETLGSWYPWAEGSNLGGWYPWAEGSTLGGWYPWAEGSTLGAWSMPSKGALAALALGGAVAWCIWKKKKESSDLLGSPFESEFEDFGPARFRW